VIPLTIRAAIALVGYVACPHCGPVEVVPDDVREAPRICHPLADCPYYLRPGSDAAVEFARSVDEEIGRYAVLADYDPDDADLPVHCWGTA
jgi:hypothetical protein